MTSSVGSTRILRDSAQRLFLAGRRQAAFDIYRCDPSVGEHVKFAQWEISFARAIVCGHSREFVEGLLRSATVDRMSDVTHCLDKMDDNDAMALECGLLRLGPATVTPTEAARLVLRIMGRL